MQKVIGKVKYVNLNMGFWSLEGRDGKKYEILNMPEQLKEDGQKIEIWIEERNNVSTMNMYGTPAMIVGFTTM